MLVPVLELTMVPTAENQRYESPWYSKGSHRAATCSQGPDITPFYLLRHSKTSPSPPNLPFLNVFVKTNGQVESHPGPLGRCWVHVEVLSPPFLWEASSFPSPREEAPKEEMKGLSDILKKQRWEYCVPAGSWLRCNSLRCDASENLWEGVTCALQSSRHSRHREWCLVLWGDFRRRGACWSSQCSKAWRAQSAASQERK